MTINKNQDSIIKWQHDILDAIASSGMEETYFFHGTSDAYLNSIEEHGLTTTEVMMRYYLEHDNGEPAIVWTQGTYWASARLAAYYAIDSAIHRGGNPILIACLRTDLENEGELIADELTLDYPPELLAQHQGKEYSIVNGMNTMDIDWHAFFRYYETVVCLSPIGYENLIVIKDKKCVDEFTSNADTWTHVPSQ